MKRIRLTLWILWRSLRTRWLANSLTVLAVVLGVGLALVVPLSASAFQRGVVDAARIFDLLVTAEGSQTQVVLNTIYYQDVPVGNIPYRVYESLAADERTVRAVPLGFGDNYRGYPLVGTTPAYFELRAGRSSPPYYQLARGSLFAGRYEAVIGAQVARDSGLAIGDTFRAAHGVVQGFEDDIHTHDYRVVGVLAATGGPSDRAIYVDMDSVWHAHGQHGAVAGAISAEHACIHIEAGPTQAVTAEPFALGLLPLTQGIHTRYDTTLADLEDGARGGFISYQAQHPRDFVFYATEEVTLTLLDSSGQELAPERIARGEDIGGCPEVATAYVYDLAQGDYTLAFGGTDAPQVSLVVEELEDTMLAREDHDSDGGDDDGGDDDNDAHTVIAVENLADAPPPDGSDTRGVTAILYASENIGDLYLIASQLERIPGVQAVFPGAVIGRLLDMLGQGQATYGLVANIILVLAVITVALNTYANATQAQKGLAVLRAVGVPRKVVAGSVLLEAALLSALGILLGVAAAFAGTMLVSQVVAARSSLTLPAPQLAPSDWLRGLSLLPAALLFALLPALTAARQSPLQHL